MNNYYITMETLLQRDDTVKFIKPFITFIKKKIQKVH